MSSSDEEDEEEGEGGKENSVEEKRMDDEDEDEDVRLDVNLSMAKLEKKIFNGFWLHDDKDVDLRIARLDCLINRRPELANSVLLRQNPHNLHTFSYTYQEKGF